MKKRFLFLLTSVVIITLILTGCSQFGGFHKKSSVKDTLSEEKIRELYDETGLSGTVPFYIFLRAVAGCQKYDFEKPGIITIIDFSKPSTENRFHVIDLNQKKLLYSTYTSHGVNTGENYAVDFSNVPGSRKSSSGFFKTAETYTGKHGYSLKLDGLEEGVNDNARKRYIVIHPADYVSEEFIKEHGRLGRSWGCPALPEEISEDIIDVIKEGSCLYAYSAH